MRKILLAATALVLLASHAMAEGLVVAPTRVVMTPGQRTAELAINNNTKVPVRYRLELVDEVMTVSGTLKVVDKFDYSAKDMLRYMPKLVSIPAGGRQTVRIMANRPATLADGDYHSHLMLEEIAAPRGSIPSDTLPENGFSVSIGVVYSMGVPVLVQQGKLDGSVKLESAALVRDASGKATALKATFSHTGNSEGVAYLSTATPEGVVATAPHIVRLYREAETVELNMPLLPAVQTATLAQLALQLRKGPEATEPVLGTFTAK